MRAVALDPRRAAAYLDLGGLYAERGRAGPAEAALLCALALEPSLAAAHASLGSIYLRAGRVEPAEKHSRLALAIDPSLVAPHQTLASLLAGQGWAAEARRHRDAAYAGRNLFVETAPVPALTVLMPITAEAGNTPVRDLMPRARIGRLRWVIEYAADDQMASLPPPSTSCSTPSATWTWPRPPPRRCAGFLARCGRPVLNPPAAIARTRRDRLPALLAGLPGVVVPPARRLSARAIEREGLASAIGRAGLKPPVLLRPVGAHGGRGLQRFDALDALGAPPPGDLYATAYHDYRSRDGLYRKYRVIYVDRRPYPYHLAIAPDWLVHYESAGMGGDARRRAEEERFLDAPSDAIGRDAMAAIAAIGRKLDLDYAGIDFAVLDDGRVLVFEANATMLAHAEEADGPFAYKNKAVAAIVSAFEAMLVAAAEASTRA